jgi:hypothetical protein
MKTHFVLTFTYRTVFPMDTSGLECQLVTQQPELARGVQQGQADVHTGPEAGATVAGAAVQEPQLVVEHELVSTDRQVLQGVG